MEPITLIIGAAVLGYAWMKSQEDKPETEVVVIQGETQEGTDTGTGTKTATFVPIKLDATEEGDEDDAFDLDPGDGSPADSGYNPSAPPNPYGQVGYNTELFPDPKSVRKTLNYLGYEMFVFDKPPPKSLVQKFQRHYNMATERKYKDAKGILVDDGIPGKKTLRALERAAFGTNGPTPDDIIRGSSWKTEFDLW